ncbi:MAG: aspartate/glutamate racemase family protein, partial [Planctomycetota bacterium]
MKSETPGHIGIVAPTVEGAALCYREIGLQAAARLGPERHPEMSLHSFQLADYMKRLRAGDTDGVGELLLVAARKLASIGADFLICPCNTMHCGWDYAAERSPVPWLHIAREVAAVAGKRGHRRIAILGTRSTCASPLYPEAFAAAGLEAVTPVETERVEVDRIIFDELLNSVILPESRERMAGIIAGLKN